MPAAIPVGDVLGAFFLGVVFSSILYGVTWFQVYLYYSKHCKHDKLFLKYFVALLFILDSLQLALIIHGFYVLGILNFGDYLADRIEPWSLKVQSVIALTLTCSVHQFYAWRIYHLSLRQFHVPALIFIMSLVELGNIIAYLVYCLQNPYFDQTRSQIQSTVAGLGVQVACDLTITSAMVYYLLTRHAELVKRANRAITTALALYCINSGLLTLISAIISLVTLVRYPNTLIFVPFYYVLVRLYACAFMAILNSRNRFRTSLDSEVEFGTVISFAPRVSTFGHTVDLDVASNSVSANTGAPKTDAVSPKFPSQSTTSDVSRTKMSSLQFAEGELCGVGVFDGVKGEHKRASCEA